MELRQATKEFLKSEFDLTSENIYVMSKEEIEDLREKCIDLEVDAVCDAQGKVTERGTVAAHTVDDLLEILVAKRTKSDPHAGRIDSTPIQPLPQPQPRQELQPA
ncbi:MAG: hypothetical protein FWG68_04755 [Defluviitaleaceae bacterium]|nr:hypothetical protein [Defluviitaleaceae bacterium]